MGGARSANSAESIMRAQNSLWADVARRVFIAVRCDDGCKQHPDGSLHLLPATETDVEISHG